MFKQITHNPEPDVIGVNHGVYQVEILEKELWTYLYYLLNET